MGRNRRVVPSMKSARYTMRSVKDARKTFAYLTRGERCGGSATGADRDTLSPASGIASAGLMARLPFLEDTSDDLVERRVLNADVDDREPVQDRAQDVRHAGPLDFQADNRALASRHFAEPLQSLRHAVAVELQPNELGAAEVL